MASGTEKDHHHEAMPKTASDAAQHDQNDLDNNALDQVAGGMMVAGGAKTTTVPKKRMTGDPCEGGQ